MEYNLTINASRPYFAEIPYYLWGTVNYDSEGDCRCPTDTEWTWLELGRRDSTERLEIASEGENWRIIGENPVAARAALFLSQRCAEGDAAPSPEDYIGRWDHAAALTRAKRVAEEFSSPKLKIFDSHLFWGGAGSGSDGMQQNSHGLADGSCFPCLRRIDEVCLFASVGSETVPIAPNLAAYLGRLSLN